MASNDPKNNRSEMDDQRDSGVATESRRPYDTSGMDWAPKSEDGDPPYRDWWVVDQDHNE